MPHFKVVKSRQAITVVAGVTGVTAGCYTSRTSYRSQLWTFGVLSIV